MPTGSKHKASPGVYEQLYDAIQANGFADNLTQAERAQQSPDQLNQMKGLRLHAAASRGDAAACGRILAEGASTRHANFEGATALIMASREGHLDCVKILLPQSDPQQTCMKGWSALGWAAIEGHLPCIKALIPASNPSSLDNMGRTALALAIQAGKGAVVNLLLPVTDLTIKDRLHGDVAKQARLYEAHGAKFKAISATVQAAVKAVKSKKATPPKESAPVAKLKMKKSAS